MSELKTVALFALTALAEIAGCYLPYLWLREGKSIWLLVPSALMAILWLWTVNGIRPTTWDIVGSAIALLGMAIIMFAPRSA